MYVYNHLTGYLAGYFEVSFMKSKALTFIKRVGMNKASLAAFLFLVCAVAANATTYTPPTGAAVTAEEVDSVWNKAVSLMSGTGGNWLRLE